MPAARQKRGRPPAPRFRFSFVVRLTEAREVAFARQGGRKRRFAEGARPVVRREIVRARGNGPARPSMRLPEARTEPPRPTTRAVGRRPRGTRPTEPRGPERALDVVRNEHRAVRGHRRRIVGARPEKVRREVPVRGRKGTENRHRHDVAFAREAVLRHDVGVDVAVDQPARTPREGPEDRRLLRRP